MVIGWLRIALRLPGVSSLKEKRHLVGSLVTRLGQDRMIGAAEVGDQDLWGNAEIGVTAIGNDFVQVEGLLQRAEAMIADDPRWEVFNVDRSLERA